MKVSIAIFAYKRPEHLQSLLQSVREANSNTNFDITIFVDGPRDGDTPMVNKTIAVATQFKLLNRCSIKIREYNFGLAKNIVSGLNELFLYNDAVIVLEDDLILSKNALAYFKYYLSEYSNDQRVGHISGWGVGEIDSPCTAYITDFMSCWGWATWRREWLHYNKSHMQLLQLIPYFKRFDMSSGQFYWQLVDNLLGNIDTWAVYWYATLFLRKKKCIMPNGNLIINAGLDGSGENCGIGSSAPFEGGSNLDFGRIDLDENRGHQKVKRYFQERRVSVLKNVYRSMLKWSNFQ